MSSVTQGGFPPPERSAAAPGVLSGQRLRDLVLDRTKDPELAEAVTVVSQVLPFKVSSYVLDELIDWTDPAGDPIYRMTLPHRDMLGPGDFAAVADVLRAGDRAQLRKVVDDVRDRLNPHPGDQLTRNLPGLDGPGGTGIQHKYRDTVLVFPRQGQTCHSYCGYCFRWAQFVGRPDLRFALGDPGEMTAYLDRHPEVTDVLITGGDPLVMRTELLARYLEPLLAPDYAHVRTIRIGTKALSFWPYRFLDAPDGDHLLRLFERVVRSGRHLALMLHLSHPRELATKPARQAVERLLATGAVLRSQAPLIRHVNDDAATWATLWQDEVSLSIVPYYLFVERDTGAREYYQVPLARAVDIHHAAVRRVSGLGRTARGPVMSTSLGKVLVSGVADLGAERVFVLQLLRARDENLVGRPFFARFDPAATWWDQLVPRSESDGEFFRGLPPI
ncbi:KamA family radical SAM protein [Amycolatopsis sp. cmx-4-83]|uniref:KamA family radical SAM protein n=1 Tax=Amycolatopsis sp. cmx-4-83 TaxID=2790940 RepID=UPI00397A7048